MFMLLPYFFPVFLRALNLPHPGGGGGGELLAKIFTVEFLCPGRDLNLDRRGEKQTHR